MERIDGTRRVLSWLGVVLLAGCSGQVQDEATRSPADGLSRAVDAPPQAAGGEPAVPRAGVQCTAGEARATTRFARITHAQYDNTVRMLTGLPLQPSRDFPVDQNQAGFDRGIDLQVGEVLGAAYRASAEAIAAAVVVDPAALERVVGCGAVRDEACARGFIARFGRRVYRRPLSAGEQSAFEGLFVQGAALVDGAASAFDKGVQVVLEGLLQSPNFLYRIELADQADGVRVPLDGYALATRLAFALTDTGPSDALLDAAAAGQLGSADAVADQARALLQTAEARALVRDFHRQWLELEALPNKLAKTPAKFPSVTPDLAPVLAEESMRFAEAVTFEERRGYRSLLVAPFAFVNRVTAPLYGLQGAEGDALQRAALDPTQRAGILTQLAFLAGHAYTDQSSPIHRGVFVQRKVLCATIPDPPANTPQPAALGPTQTTRQQIDTLTSVSPCNGCHHTLINPVGFAFEAYDAVGQFRREENGAPIDASGKLAGTMAAGQGKADFRDAIEASGLIADSVEGRRCYAATWLRYTFGRVEDPSERCLLDELSARLADDNYTVAELLVDLTRTPSFLSRAAGGP